MTRELGHMATAALSVESAFEGVKGAFEDGSHFKQLADRTGESVRELVILDKAYRNAGLGAESIGHSANLLQKALGGVNDMGGRTDVVFRRIGTSIEELKELPFAQQLEVISEGLGKVENQSERANIVMQLFGRSGGQMLQLLSSPEGLKLAAEQAGRLGDRMEQSAHQFHEVEDRLGVINSRLKEMWTVAAVQLLPTLTNIAQLFEKLNLSGVGAFMGGASPGILGAMGAGYLFDKADSSLYSLLGKMEEGSCRTMVRGISNAMGAIASFVPAILAAIIAGSVIKGVLDAMADSNIQQFQRDANAVREAMKDARKKAGGISSQEGAANTLEASKAELDKYQSELADLEKKKSAAAQAWENYGTGNGPAIWNLPKFSDEQESRLGDLPEIIKKQELLIRELQDPGKVQTTIAENQLKAIKAGLEPLVAQLPSLSEKNDKLNLENMEPAALAKELQGRRTRLEGELSNAPAGLTEDETKARSLNLTNQILELKKQEAEVGNKLADQAKKLNEEEVKRSIYALETQMKVAQAAGDNQLAQTLKEEIEQRRAIAELSGLDLKLANERRDAEHRIWEEEEARRKAKSQIESQRTALENSLTAIRTNLVDIEADYTRTEAEKWKNRKDALEQEIALLREKARIERELAIKARAPGGAGEQVALMHNKAGDTYSKQMVGAQGEKGRLGPDPNNWVQQTKKSLTELRNAWGTTSQQIAHNISSVIGGAVNSITSNITSCIMGAQTLGQAFARIGMAIYEAIITAIVEMGVKWVATKIMMAIADKGIAAGSVA
ncbi:MAG: hypothetical protein WC378_13920, partial [Opitutaceae bacterium]